MFCVIRVVCGFVGTTEYTEHTERECAAAEVFCVIRVVCGFCWNHGIHEIHGKGACRDLRGALFGSVEAGHHVSPFSVSSLVFSGSGT